MKDSQNLSELLWGKKTGEMAVDELTRKPYEKVSEGLVDIAAVTFSILYLIAMLIFLSWQLIETFIGQNLIMNWVISEGEDYPNSSLFKLISCTVIAGGLGGVINGIRTVIFWHPEKRASSWRFTWKYITLPLLGAGLAAIVYAITGSGIAAISGDFTVNGNFTAQALAAFAIGALSGYGSHEGFKWLNAQVYKLFKTKPSGKVIVPELKDKTEEKADEFLNMFNLKLSKVIYETTTDPNKVGKVIKQEPVAGSIITEGASINVFIGRT
ncbi:MAG: PASTA domain-containing protein [candidate division Zixibacteria bacterium]